MTPEQQSLAEKRARAIEYLGEKWVLHPRYRHQKRHNNNLADWYPNRSLRHVEQTAREAGRI